jgi:BlaI family transcriptional regulator, penicillinase repressor
MKLPRLSQLELRIMEVVWSRGPCSVREVLENLPDSRRPAHTTVQTMMVRLEAKGALRRSGKIANAHIYEAAISREAAQRRLANDFLGLFGGKMQPLMAYFAEAGKLTLADVEEAERHLRELARIGKKR